jgi:hypothetical protein
MRRISLFCTLALIVAISGTTRVEASELLGGSLLESVQKSDGKGGSDVWASGVYVMPELLLLRPFNSDGDDDSDTDTKEYRSAMRLTVGYTADSGLGARVRWLDYDVNAVDDDFQTQTVDTELFSNVELGCRWLATFSGGIRYAEMTETEGDGSLENGYGVIVGMEVQYLWSDRISLYSIARHSVLFGDDDEDDDLAVSATELQIGAQYNRCLNNGALAFARAGIEGQHWDGWADEDSETFGLFGGVFAVGYQR